MVAICLAIPGMIQWLERSTESAVFSLLNHMVVMARTRAIRDQTHFTVCASEDKIYCADHWNRQIIVFNDPNTNETRDQGERLYKAITLPEGTPCISWNASLGRRYLQFKPTGASNGSAGHFRLCDGEGSYLNRKLVVSLNGRTSLQNL